MAVGGQEVDGQALHVDGKNAQALNGVDEVFHLAALPGMWEPNKADFHAINYQGTEVVMAAARKRDVRRFLHCSTESILFPSTPADDHPVRPPNPMFGSALPSNPSASCGPDPVPHPP